MTSKRLPLALGAAFVSLLTLTSSTAIQAAESPAPASPEGEANFEIIPGTKVFPDRLLISPDGALVAAASLKGISIWSASSGKVVRTLPGGVAPALSPDGSQLAVGDVTGAITILDFTSGKTIRTLSGHPQPETTDQWSDISALAYTTDGKTLASASSIDSKVKLWHTADGTLQTELDLPAKGVTDVVISPNGSYLVTSGIHLATQVWDLTSKRSITTVTKTSQKGHDLAYSPDGNQLALVDRAAPTKVQVFDAHTFKLKYTAPTNQTAFNPAYDPTGKTLAYSLYNEKQVICWQPGSTKVQRFTGHTNEPGAVVFSPDGNTLYSVSSHDGVIAWNTNTGKLQRRFDLP
jgi:WD40 repeat protein